MDALLKFVGAIILVALLVFVTPLIGVVFGAFAGWVVSFFYPATLAKVAVAMGIAGTPGWQLGAGLGFVGGFFKASLTTTEKK